MKTILRTAILLFLVLNPLLALAWDYASPSTAGTTPLSLVNGGTQCSATTYGTLPSSPPNGTICSIANANGCTAGSAVTGTGSNFCTLTYLNGNWMPAGGASGGGVNSGNQNQTAIYASTGTVVTGTNSITQNNWDGVIDPTNPTYGAKCDGSTDDTAAFCSALGNGHAIHIPTGKLCVIAVGGSTSTTCGASTGFNIHDLTGVTIFGDSKYEPSGSTPTSGMTGLYFTGTPAACAPSSGSTSNAGIGGLLNINNSYGITFRDLALWFGNASASGYPYNSASDCAIYVYNSNRVVFQRVQITNPGNQIGQTTPGVSINAIQLEENDESSYVDNFFDAGFVRAFFYPQVSGNFTNRVRIVGNRIAAPNIPNSYEPLVDYEGGNSTGTGPQNLLVANNTMEQDPSGFKIGSGGFGIEVSTNYFADGYGAANNWVTDHCYTAGKDPSVGGSGFYNSGQTCIYEAVNGSNMMFCPTYTSTTGCSSTQGESGGTQPTWTSCATPGSSCTDNNIIWYNEGFGIGAEINMTSGSVHDNLFSSGNLVALKLDQPSSGVNVFGNRIGYAYRDGIEDYGIGSKIGSNLIYSNATNTIASAFVRVGVTSACTGTNTSTSSQHDYGCGSSSCSISNWAGSTDYALGNTVLDSNGNTEYVSACTGSCESLTSGSPSWTKTIGATTSDNQITWTLYEYGSSCTAYGNQIDTQAYEDESGNSNPFLLVSPNTSGNASYNANQLSASRISFSSTNGSSAESSWIVQDAAGQVGSASGSGTSGTYSCKEIIRGANPKIVSCYLNGYAETGTAQTYSYPVAFSTYPTLLEGGSGGNTCGTYNPSTTASTLTLPANPSMTTETCTITAIGQ
jgi:hypothetical protein